MSKLPSDGGGSRLSFVVFTPCCWFDECALAYMHECTTPSRTRRHAHARAYTNACTCTLTARSHILPANSLTLSGRAQVSGALPDFEFDIDFDVPPASGGA